MRLASVLAVLSLACSPVGSEPDPGDSADLPDVPLAWTEPGFDTLEDPGPAPVVPLEATISVEPHPDHPLLAVVEVWTDVPTELSVLVDGPGVVEREDSTGGGATHHRHVVAGLRQESDYTVSVEVVDGRGSRVGGEYAVRTGAIPFPLPTPVTVTQPGDPGGLLLMGVRYAGQERPETLYFAIDGEGEVVWYFQNGEANGDLPLIRSRGDRTFSLFYMGETWIVDVEGDMLHRFVDDRSGEPWHHDRIETPEGGLLVMSSEVQLAALPEGQTFVAGDVVLNLAHDGTLVNRWSALDHLDPTRFPGPLSRQPWGAGLDWSHGNALAETPDGEGWVTSLRHQHWIVRVDRATAEVDWVLGRDGDFELTRGTWFDSQHNPEFVGTDELLVYDNGTERYRAGGMGSRVVRYRIDEEARTVAQLWSWPVPVFTPIVGGVQQWGEHVLVTAGGRQDARSSIYLVDEAGDVDWSVDVGQLQFRTELVEAL